MNSYSTTQTGNLVAFAGLIVTLANYMGYAFTQEEMQALLGAIAILIGIITSWVGRYKQGDLKISGFRK